MEFKSIEKTTRKNLRPEALRGCCSLAIATFFLLCLAAQVDAHGSGFPFRYVAPNGVDSGDCDDPSAPCRTIRYAIDQARPGDQVRVAGGTYFFDKAEIALLLSEIILVKGGYTSADAFTIQDPIRHPTYLLGLNHQYGDLLGARGFALIRDAKEAELAAGAGQRAAGTTTDQSSQNAPTGITTCVEGLAGIYPCAGINLLSHIPLSSLSSNPTVANDIWGFVDQNDGQEYAIIGLNNGTAIVNVSDPQNPVEVGLTPGLDTIWRDIKIYQFYNDALGRWATYAYVSADGVSQGLQIIDLTNLPDSISLAATYSGFSQAHNIYLGNVDYVTGIAQSGLTAYAYILGSDLTGGSFRILDLAVPTAPVEVAAPIGAEYVHDATTFVISDTRADDDCHVGHNPCELYVDFNEDTVDIWDVTDKASAHKISSTGYMGFGYTHSGWWSEDKMFIFIQDEFDELKFGHNTRLHILDISDLTVPFISRIWTGPTKAIDHNGFVKNNHYYMSNYRRGLTILDITNPNDPYQLAFFDTYPTSDSANFSGAWGVYPFLPSGTILVSDINSGLFLLREQGLAISKTGPVAAMPGEPITYTLTIANNGTLSATNIVITDAIPAGATYLRGGTTAANMVEWTIDTLPRGGTAEVTFTVSATATLTNNDYRVRADGSVSTLGSVSVAGNQSVVTTVGAANTYLPLILKN